MTFLYNGLRWSRDNRRFLHLPVHTGYNRLRSVDPARVLARISRHRDALFMFLILVQEFRMFR